MGRKLNRIKESIKNRAGYLGAAFIGDTDKQIAITIKQRDAAYEQLSSIPQDDPAYDDYSFKSKINSLRREKAREKYDKLFEKVYKLEEEAKIFNMASFEEFFDALDKKSHGEEKSLL